MVAHRPRRRGHGEHSSRITLSNHQLKRLFVSYIDRALSAGVNLYKMVLTGFGTTYIVSNIPKLGIRKTNPVIAKCFLLLSPDIQCDDPGQRRRTTVGHQVCTVLQRRRLHVEVYQRHLWEEKGMYSNIK